jgi:hypothetical protein
MMGVVSLEPTTVLSLFTTVSTVNIIHRRRKLSHCEWNIGE